jgi:hypothetical protein
MRRRLRQLAALATAAGSTQASGRLNRKSMTVVTSVPVTSKGGMKEAPVIRCL